MTVRTITLAGVAYAVPELPLGINMQVYPICARLTTGGLIDRCIEGGGNLVCTPEEMADLAEIAFQAARAAGAQETREEFDRLPITPPELLNAFFEIRIQTGAWTVAEPAGGDTPGEAPGAKAPAKRRRTSTSKA